MRRNSPPASQQFKSNVDVLKDALIWGGRQNQLAGVQSFPIEGFMIKNSEFFLLGDQAGSLPHWLHPSWLHSEPGGQAPSGLYSLYHIQAGSIPCWSPTSWLHAPHAGHHQAGSILGGQPSIWLCSPLATSKLAQFPQRRPRQAVSIRYRPLPRWLYLS